MTAAGRGEDLGFGYVEWRSRMSSMAGHTATWSRCILRSVDGQQMMDTINEGLRMYGLEDLMINHEKYEIQYQEYDLDCHSPSVDTEYWIRSLLFAVDRTSQPTNLSIYVTSAHAHFLTVSSSEEARYMYN